MFRFVSLFALVAVALAEPEADPQLFYNNVGVAGVPVVHTYAAPVVKYVDPHHTEGMTKAGVPEKTDSAKIAEKQLEIYENAKPQYVAPHYAYSGYAGVYSPYIVGGVYSPYTYHHLGKREADSNADAQYFYNGYRYPSAHHFGYNAYPYAYNSPYAYRAHSVHGYYY